MFVISVYRTFNIWNQPNSHPLFAESDARYHAIALAKMRKLLYIVLTVTGLTCLGWSGITFFGESTKGQYNKELNETEHVPIPRLPIKSSYPFRQMDGIGYFGSFIFQVYSYSHTQNTLRDILQKYYMNLFLFVHAGLLLSLLDDVLQFVRCHVLLLVDFRL